MLWSHSETCNFFKKSVFWNKLVWKKCFLVVRDRRSAIDATFIFRFFVHLSVVVFLTPFDTIFVLKVFFIILNESKVSYHSELVIFKIIFFWIIILKWLLSFSGREFSSFQPTGICGATAASSTLPFCDDDGIFVTGDFSLFFVDDVFSDFFFQVSRNRGIFCHFKMILQ